MTVLDLGEDMKLDGMGITHDNVIEAIKDGKVFRPKAAWTEESYGRAKGPKIVHRSYLPGDKLTLAPHDHLKPLSLLFAVDTNTQTIAGHRISVACVAFCFLKSHPMGLLVKPGPTKCFEFWNIAGDPERFSVAFLIGQLESHPTYRPSLRIGIVIDSHLGALPQLNERVEPIFGGKYLPSNMQLLYASADVSSDYFPNKMMRFCDQQAAIVLDAIQQNPYHDPGLTETPDAPYTHARVYHFEDA